MNQGHTSANNPKHKVQPEIFFFVLLVPLPCITLHFFNYLHLLKSKKSPTRTSQNSEVLVQPGQALQDFKKCFFFPLNTFFIFFSYCLNSKSQKTKRWSKNLLWITTTLATSKSSAKKKGTIWTQMKHQVLKMT